MAKAACGVASKAGSHESQQTNLWRTKPWASKRATVPHANTVETKPVHKVRPKALSV
jgi:hypothetical protein